MNTAFIRTGFTVEPIDRFVFFYGRLCGEDFFEVLLCCGNGYGVAALKLLRTLYERAVTLQYLHEHPEELDALLDFHLHRCNSVDRLASGAEGVITGAHYAAMWNLMSGMAAAAEDSRVEATPARTLADRMKTLMDEARKEITHFSELARQSSFRANFLGGISVLAIQIAFVLLLTFALKNAAML